MSFLRNALLVNSAMRGRTRGRGYGRRRPARSGFGFRGPFPTYSRQTRRGTRVSVSGCCLPIPLALTLGTGAALTRAIRTR